MNAPEIPDFALSVVLGIGLAAATGFRVFLPMLIMSGAAYTGHLQLDNSFAWLATSPALTMLGVAAVAEVLAYYVPGSTTCSMPWPRQPHSSRGRLYQRRSSPTYRQW